MKVKVTVFKLSGKFYTNETLAIDCNEFHEMLTYIKAEIYANRIPGLVEGAREFHVLVQEIISKTGLEEDLGVPHLFTYSKHQV